MVQRFNVLTPHSPRPTATHCEPLRINSTFNPCLADFFFFAPQPLCAFALPRSCNSCHSWLSYPFRRPTCDNLRSLATPPEIACDSLSWSLQKSQPISTHLNPPQPISPKINFSARHSRRVQGRGEPDRSQSTRVQNSFR
jgi:hypothetical protein